MSCDESSKSDVVQTVTLDEIALNLPQEKPLNVSLLFRRSVTSSLKMTKLPHTVKLG